MIGIIGAMQTEVELLIGKLEGAKKETVSGIDFFSGILNDREVVIAKCGIGKVFAAICAQTMILRFGVSLIINTGVGGAISDELEIGDIAVSTAVVQHDMDTSAIGDPVGLISGINVIEIPADKKIADTVMAAADVIGYRCLSGIVASGDRFIAGKENKKKIADTFSALVVIGIVGKVVLQALLNIAVVTNSIPNTGISLPFFSSGGTALMVQIFEVGIILAISRYSAQKQ